MRRTLVRPVRGEMTACAGWSSSGPSSPASSRSPGAITVVVQRRAAAQEMRDRRAALAVGRQFLADWPAKRYEHMTALAAAGNDPGTSYRALDRRLMTTTVEVVPGVLAKDGRHLPFTVHLQLKGLGRLDWQTALELTRAPDGWRVLFRSDAVYPGLRNGQRLERSAQVITRGQLLDRHGAPIRAMSADLASNVLEAADGSRTGLERLYDAKLTGTSGGRVELLDGRTGQRTVIKEVSHCETRGNRSGCLFQCSSGCRCRRR